MPAPLTPDPSHSAPRTTQAKRAQGRTVALASGLRALPRASGVKEHTVLFVLCRPHFQRGNWVCTTDSDRHPTPLGEGAALPPATQCARATLRSVTVDLYLPSTLAAWRGKTPAQQSAVASLANIEESMQHAQ